MRRARVSRVQYKASLTFIPWVIMGHLIIIYIPGSRYFTFSDPRPRALASSRPSAEVSALPCQLTCSSRGTLTELSHTQLTRQAQKTRVSTVSGRKVNTKHMCTAVGSRVQSFAFSRFGRRVWVVRLTWCACRSLISRSIPEYPRAARARREPGASQARARCEPGASQVRARCEKGRGVTSDRTEVVTSGARRRVATRTWS